MAEYLFTDLHMHTKFSDEDLCDEKPKHILGKVQKYADEFNKRNGTNMKCAISFSDHNTTLGCVKAQELLQTGEYPNVTFINGIEFTVDLCEVNKKLGEERSFTRCHLLGYNYDITNKELLAYSKVAHKFFSNEDNVGLQICAARRAICEAYDIYIPFSKFEHMADMSQNANYVTEFISVIKAFFIENNIKFNVDEVYSRINEYLVGANSYVPESTSFGRVKLSEAVKLVKDAGGDVVLAHPSYLRVTLDGIKNIVNRIGSDGDEAYAYALKQPNKKGKLNVQHLHNDKLIKLVLDTFTDVAEEVAGYKIDGYELYYANNYFSRVDEVLQKIITERGMYATGGSDYHGENFATHKTIGNFLNGFVQRQYGRDMHKTQARNLYIRLSRLPAIDKFVENKNINADAEVKFIDETAKTITWEEINDAINFYQEKNNKFKSIDKNEEKHFNEKNSYTEVAQKQIAQNIQNLFDVADKYNSLLNKHTSFKERRKLILKLDLFCRSIYTSIEFMQKEFRDHSERYEIEHVKKITNVLKEIHRKYDELLRLDNGIMYDLQKALRRKHNIFDTTIDKLANITIKDDGKDA